MLAKFKAAWLILASGQILIFTYAILDEFSIPEDWGVSFWHLNGNSVSGIVHKFLPFSAVQFHPESTLGTRDTFYFFEQFIDAVIKHRIGSL